MLFGAELYARGFRINFRRNNERGQKLSGRSFIEQRRDWTCAVPL